MGQFDLTPAHIGLSVYHMDKSIAWYQRVLGCFSGTAMGYSLS